MRVWIAEKRQGIRYHGHDCKDQFTTCGLLTGYPRTKDWNGGRLMDLEAVLQRYRGAHPCPKCFPGDPSSRLR